MAFFMPYMISEAQFFGLDSSKKGRVGLRMMQGSPPPPSVIIPTINAEALGAMFTDLADLNHL